MTKNKWYVVWIGRTPGIFETWSQCNDQVKGFSKAKYMSFNTINEAEIAFTEGWEVYWGKKDQRYEKLIKIGLHEDVDVNSVAVDVSCLGPNGPMEFRGIDLKENLMIFSKGPFKKGTSNIGEFLAIVEALQYLENKKSSRVVYSDSLIAIGWVQKKVCNTTLLKNGESEDVFILVEKAIQWLKGNNYPNVILKWNTSEWGEIPADYGRK